MLEIESFWNGIPGFYNTEKSVHNYIGYGYVKRTKWKYAPSRMRKARREIRKYGFDLSETWNLDTSIMRWLSDEFGGFFRKCGHHDRWSEYDLEGNRIDFWTHKDDRNYYVNATFYENTRNKSYLIHLKDLLDNGTEEEKKKIADFCAPRLRALAKNTNGYPPVADFPEFEDWTACLNDMAQQFEDGKYSEMFVKYFFSLWD